MSIFSDKGVGIRTLPISEFLKEFHGLARKFCYDVITPPALKGKSGIVHSFSLLLASKGKLAGVDIHEIVGEVEVLKTYVKKLDTGVSAFLVSTNGNPALETRALSEAYDVRIFTRSELDEMLNANADPSLPAFD